MTRDESFDETLGLLRRAKAGEPSAMDLLLERHGERLLGRVRLMMGEEARRQAESVDFLQELFVEVIEGFDRAALTDEGAFVRWATQIARNNIRDRVRRRRERALDSFTTAFRGGRPEPGAERPSQLAMGQEETERLIDGLERLKPDYQRVIELRDFEGLSFKEIASRMNRPSENAVQMLHARALTQLTQILS